MWNHFSMKIYICKVPFTGYFCLLVAASIYGKAECIKKIKFFIVGQKDITEGPQRREYLNK